MLVLSRKENEVVNIYTRLPNGNAGMFVGSVTLVQIRGDKARLGFDFPQEILLLRHDARDLKDKKGED